MLGFIKKLFKKKPPTLDKGEVKIRFRLPNGKEFDVYAVDPKLIKK